MFLTVPTIKQRFPPWFQCLIKSAFGHPNDECILHPKKCDKGISFSIWERVLYAEDVLNVHKSHDKQYVFSTGEALAIHLSFRAFCQLFFPFLRW